MEIKIGTGAILVPADASTAEQFLKHGGVEVKPVEQEEPKTKSRKKVVAE